MQRRIVGIVLLVLWIFQCTFVFLLVQTGRMQCHYQHFSPNRRTYRTEDIQTLVFHKTTKINWKIAEKEFRHDGKLYDVFALTSHNDSVIIYCVWDEKEDAILAHFQNYMDGNLHQHATIQSIPKIVKSKYFAPTINTIQFADYCLNTNPLWQMTPVEGFALDVLSPPPEV